MSQIFHRSANALSRATIVGAVVAVAALAWVANTIQRSPYITYAGVRKPQPVPFSHKHHVTGLGLDSATATLRSKPRASPAFPLRKPA